MVSQNHGGANIEARLPKPSIDLATVVELLTKAISPKENRGNTGVIHPDYYQLFVFDVEKKRLQLCTSAVLRRLFGNQDFKAAFNPAEGGGFIQNLPMPISGNRSRIGGYLKEDNAVRLSVAVDKLISGIDAILPPENLLSLLLLDKPIAQLQQLGKAANTVFNNQVNTANIVPIAFPGIENKTNHQNKAVAKVISVRERIDADDYFEKMCHAVKEHMQYQLDSDEDDIDLAVDSLRAEKDRVDSQLSRFLNFLDDEALARVRLTITFQIMEAIAEHSRSNNQPKYQTLVEYVHRVTNFLGLAKEVGYTIDLTTHFGIAAEFELLDYLNTAIFYSCLPVWPEWKTQIFEEKISNPLLTSYGVVREVSYRFRINGNNPEENKPAFEARLDKISKELIGDDENSSPRQNAICRNLATLIFLVRNRV